MSEHKDLSGQFYLAEFSALREEIVAHSKRQSELFLIALLLFSGMSTVALTKGGKSKRLLLLYPFVAMFLTELCYDSGEAIHLIGRYIEGKTEPRFAAMAWEKWLASSGIRDPIVSRRLHRNRAFFIATQLGSFAIYLIGGASAARGGNLKDFSPSSMLLFSIGLAAMARTSNLQLPVRTQALEVDILNKTLRALWGADDQMKTSLNSAKPTTIVNKILKTRSGRWRFPFFKISE